MTGVQTCALPIYLSRYGTADAVRDLEDVRYALAYDQIDLKIGRASCRERV